MASPTPPPPNEVPETDATYERTNMENTLERKDAVSPGAGVGGAARTGPLDDSLSKASAPMQSSKQRSSKGSSASSSGSAGAQRSDVAHPSPLPAGGKIVGNMKTEEPQGWDQAPTDIKNPRDQRHPRPDGVGGSDPDSAKRDPQR